MGKPGEMVQILREDYEEQLEAYRILRNKFLIAVPVMDLDKEKQLYDQWKLDLHLNSIISFDRALPPELRTCETCGTPYCDQYKRGGSCPNYSPRDVSADIAAADRVLAWIKAELGWSLGDPDTGELGPEGIETRNRLASVIGTRPVSAEDVETVRSKVREAFDLGVRHGKWLATYTGPIGILHRVDDIDGQLDRISGKGEPRHD